MHVLVCVERWWATEGEGGEERGVRPGGGEKHLRRFLSLRVESSRERAAVYSGDDPVSIKSINNRSSFITNNFYQIYSSSSKEQRGMHVVILNQATVRR